MKISYNIDKDSKTIFVKAVGEITVNDLIEIEKKIINNPHFESGLNTLADFTRAKPADNVNYQSITISRDFVSSIQHIRGQCKWAFIAPNDPAYGVSTMFSTLSTGLRIEFEVFRTKREAKKWLGLE